MTMTHGYCKTSADYFQLYKKVHLKLSLSYLNNAILLFFRLQQMFNCSLYSDAEGGVELWYFVVSNFRYPKVSTYLSSLTVITPSSRGMNTAMLTSSLKPSSLLKRSGFLTFPCLGPDVICAAILLLSRDFHAINIEPIQSAMHYPDLLKFHFPGVTIFNIIIWGSR